MSTRRINSYSFASDAQWNRCLAVGFGAPDGNGMSLPPRLGTHARRIGGKEPCTAIAADSFGTPFWRATIANGEEGISWRDEFDRLFGPFPLDHVVAETRRLQADRYGLWAFAPDRVIRHDRASLQRDMTIPAAAMSAADSTTILDIAVDGRGGLWVLLDETRGQRLVHVDCRGCVGAVWAVPCEIQGAMELAVVDSGRILALLSPKDRRLAVVDAADGKLMRMLWLGALDACFEPTRIASNAADCLVLSGIREGRHGQEWCLFALDRFGEPTRPALSDIFRAPDMRRLAEAVQVFDFAVARDRIWFATSGGLWILDASPASGSMGAKAVLLTPLLHAPPDGEAPGWLRAEIEIDLPEGAGVTASFATAQDARLAGRIAMIEADESQPRHVRQDSIWSLLDRGKSGERRFTAASGPDFPGRLSIPIFGTDHPWLAVKLDIDVPPFVSAPRLKSMRVLYPEQTLMRSLPAIFAHPDHDPERVLRRLVGVIEATSQAIDEKIDSIGSLID